MSKAEKPVGKKFSVKDILVIVLSLVALAGLIYIMKTAKAEEKQKEETLGNISGELQGGGTIGEMTGQGSGLTTGVMINELNQAGWLELYHTGKTNCALGGLKVYVGGDLLYEAAADWTLAAGEHAVLELGSTLDAYCDKVLELRKADGESLEYMIIPALQANESFGAVTDGGIEKAFLTATKGADNGQATVQAQEQLSFSVPGGFYESAFSLEISAPKDCKVYYTTDGTQPTTESALYSEPLTITNRSGGNYVYATGMQENFFTPNSIDMGTIVRAILVDAAGKQLEEKTASYFVGFMYDTDYVNLPVLSITTNPENLFDYFSGIYVKGRSYEDAVASGSIEQAANYFNGWTKPAYIEYFEANKDKSYEGEVQLGIAWDMSIASSQKSFTIKSKGALPEQGSTLTKYFNSASNLLQVTTYHSDNGYKIREQLVQVLLDEYTDAALDTEPCIVFVDGEYWGLYMLRENFDTGYLQTSYDTGDTRLMFRRNGILQEPEEKASYIELKNNVILNDLSIKANYEAVKNQLDIQSYIDNICINMYLANADYGNTNKWWRSWKTTEDSEYGDGLWRLVLPQFDNSMHNGYLGMKTTYSIDSFLMPSVTQDAFFQSLLMNREFREQLDATMKTLAEEVFTMEKVEEALAQIGSSMEKASLSSYKRFNGNTTSDYYKAELEKIRSFFALRKEYILYYTEELVEKGGNREVIEAGRADILSEAEKEELAESEALAE
ncbi:MAG: CotH kinase family protein [Lachnospiraceae bacterium]|nr:CotH kinase family protein [Lachnospiraceae bacterium]